MTVDVHDIELADRLVQERKAAGLDQRDEVWEGVSVVSPLAGTEHQRIVMKLSWLLEAGVGETGARVYPGLNVSDRNAGWVENYRIPDIAVFLQGGAGVVHETHAEGGPDFLVEILSEDDPALEKLPFYAANGVREALYVHRNPEWRLELYRNEGGTLRLAESATEGSAEIRCEVVPLALRLISDPEGGRPLIEARQTDGGLSRIV